MANPQLPPPKVLIADPISTRGVEELSREGALDVHVQTGITPAELLQRQLRRWRLAPRRLPTALTRWVKLS